MTFLFTDIEGSTRLWEEKPEAMRDALARHDEVLRAAFESRGGFVFSTGGDGFAVAFGRAGDAVGSAIAAQHDLLAIEWPLDTLDEIAKPTRREAASGMPAPSLRASQPAPAPRWGAVQ